MKNSIFFCLILLLTACNNESQELSNDDQELSYEMYSACIENLPRLGEFNGQSLSEGGFSGLIYIPGSDLEFYTVTDRGPNTSMKSLANYAGMMLFPLPNYTQKIIRLKLENITFKIKSIHPILDQDGNEVGGFPPLELSEESREIASKNAQGDAPVYRAWNFDFEGISIDANGDIWLVDEYRPALVYVDGKSFQIKEVFSAEKVDMGGTRILDLNFAKRTPNRGFEGVAITPSGKVLAILQSPIQDFESFDSLPSRLVRILHFDPAKGKSKVFGYEMSENLIDPKIGDIAAINEHEFLIIEHGKDSSGKVANIYRLDLEYATDILQMNFGLGTSFEALLNNAKAQYHGLILAQKTHVLDLIAAGFNSEYGKPEGLTIINESSIAVVNDNDFGVDKINEQGQLVMNGQPCCIFVFTFNKPIFKR